MTALFAAQDDPAVAGLDVYIVGGAVRDGLLGLQAGDRDWVVVGASPEIMAARGFTPVGGDFPVFLHPRTHEEYALARTERKSGRGYRGFVFHAGPDVTLEDDLRRRDLTVNAIALASDGTLVDPLGGVADVRARVLRHTGPAFVEDPVRLLRLARFAARFHDFSIAPETLELCRALVRDGEVDALVPERIWQEFAKGLMTDHPGRMLDVLDESGALERVAPGLVWRADVAAGLAQGATRGLDLAGRYALLCRCSAPSLQDRLRAPSACRDLARLLPGVLERLPHAAESDGPAAWLALLESCDALRRPERFEALLAAAGCVLEGVDPAVWMQRQAAVRAVDAGAIARAAGGDAARIRDALCVARLQALERLRTGA
ncbi:CCA tRNA nucleotidyltransferase [Castellaniella sp.]|uniref:CCA tRNA nucleotidyltransferase n=1 Tax=Castellaniella sp. TaxID=1955812 RepID=UPI002D7EF693|nr:CCA tRNA nucleotidyltransferase [Castellaniella sp.]HET8703037.1 CCA tRNA nucleotidyltransferase [Castellaniella sp.]